MAAWAGRSCESQGNGETDGTGAVKRETQLLDVCALQILMHSWQRDMKKLRWANSHDVPKYAVMQCLRHHRRRIPSASSRQIGGIQLHEPLVLSAEHTASMAGARHIMLLLYAYCVLTPSEQLNVLRPGRFDRRWRGECRPEILREFTREVK